MTTVTAPGKIILAGEHAVVYGRPAIAIPVWQVTATAAVTEGTAGIGCHLLASQIGLDAGLTSLGRENALATVTWLALGEIGCEREPDWSIKLHSDIPIASGLGSGAAISAALVRTIFDHVGHVYTAEDVSRLVFESERLFHGTPSGIDNTVVAYGEPVWFVKGEPPSRFQPGGIFTFVIADSGIAAPTKETVGDVRRAWHADRLGYEAIFDEIGEVVRAVRGALEAGDGSVLGALFGENQLLLEQLKVSSRPLERLIAAAHAAGALGAKLSGGGRGGNIIALVEPDQVESVSSALDDAGARRLIVTQLAP